MSRSLEPLDSDIAAILGSAKELDPVPPELTARVISSVASRVGVPPTDGGGAAGAGSGTAPAASALSVRAMLLAGVSMALGAGAAAMVLRPAIPVERIVYVDRVLPSASTGTLPGSARAAVPVEPERQPVEVAGSSSAVLQGASAKPPLDSQGKLAAESALLDIARVAVAQGNAERALEAVERHRRQFPSGLLSEEREALSIKALHLLGRDPEARTRAARFARMYPKSLFLPVIRGVLEAAP